MFNIYLGMDRTELNLLGVNYQLNWTLFHLFMYSTFMSLIMLFQNCS